MDITFVLGAALAALAAYNVGGYLFRKDTEVEDRRRAAAKLAGVLRSQGLVRLPAILEDYSVGDYSGLGNRIKNIVELLGDGEEVVQKEFDGVFNRVLEAKVKTPEGLALLKAKVGDAEAKPVKPVQSV